MGEFDDTLGATPSEAQRLYEAERRLSALERVIYCEPGNAHGAVSSPFTARPKAKGRSRE